MNGTLSEFLGAWQTNERINFDLIDGISDEGLQSTLSKRGGRDVARQFGHLHDLRIWQLEKRAPDLAEGLNPFESKCSPSRQELKEALTVSGGRVSRFLEDLATGVDGKGVSRRRGFKTGIFTTLSYFISHESHHRGNILATLKANQQLPSKAVQYGIWGAWK